jgi:hypothetical protein
MAEAPSLVGGRARAQPQVRRAFAVASDPALLAEIQRCVAGLQALPEGPLSHRFVFFGWDGNPAGREEMAVRLRRGATVVAVLSDSDLVRFTSVLRAPRFDHVIAYNEAMAENLAMTAGKLFSGDIFGIEKHLPPGTAVRYLRLRDNAGRSSAMDEINAFAAEVKVRRALRTAICQVAEELLMNALFDAPVDDQGRPVFSHVNTTERKEMRSPRPVSIRFAATGDLFAVAVRDRFGTFDKQTLLDYLEKCLHAENQIDGKARGAGLGLYLIAKHATQLVVNIAPGVATEVVCTFDRRSGRVPLRLLSIFVHPGVGKGGPE